MDSSRVWNGQWIPWLSWCVSALVGLEICLNCKLDPPDFFPFPPKWCLFSPPSPACQLWKSSCLSLFGILARAQVPFSKPLTSSAMFCLVTTSLFLRMFHLTWVRQECKKLSWHFMKDTPLSGDENTLKFICLLFDFYMSIHLTFVTWESGWLWLTLRWIRKLQKQQNPKYQGFFLYIYIKI